MSTLKYGRLAPAPVPVRDLTHYLSAPLPTPPSAVDAPHLAYPMAGNDRYGDCTIAAVIHVDQATANLTAEPWTYPGDEVVVTEYLRLSGGKDTGLVEANVLKVWSTSGLFGHKLAGFASLNVRHLVPIRQAVSLCGAAYTGVLVPAPAQRQFAAGEVWDLTGTDADSEIEGGHAVPIVGYNRTGPIFVTWGALQQATWRWWNAYAEEAYAVLTADVKARGELRNVNFSALEADLKRL